MAIPLSCAIRGFPTTGYLARGAADVNDFPVESSAAILLVPTLRPWPAFLVPVLVPVLDRKDAKSAKNNDYKLGWTENTQQLFDVAPFGSEPQGRRHGRKSVERQPNRDFRQ